MTAAIEVFSSYGEANAELQKYLARNMETMVKQCSAPVSDQKLEALIHLFAYGSSVYGFRLDLKQAKEYCSDPYNDLVALVDGIQGKLEEQSTLYRSMAIVPVFYTVEEELRGNSIPEEKKEELRRYLLEAPEILLLHPDTIEQHIDLYLTFIFKEDKMRALSEEEQRIFLNAYFPKKLN